MLKKIIVYLLVTGLLLPSVSFAVAEVETNEGVLVEDKSAPPAKTDLPESLADMAKATKKRNEAAPKGAKPTVVLVDNKPVPVITYPKSLYLGGRPVLSAPYIGVRQEFDGSNLIVNIPSINEDLRLLEQKEQYLSTFYENHVSLPSHPYLAYSGKLEGLGFYSMPYGSGYSTSGVDLAAAEIDLGVMVNDWAIGFIGFSYDNAPSNVLYVPRTLNSNVFLSKGFISFGNLSKSPFYGTVGQLIIPFGTYSTSMISAPLTAFIGKTLARMLLVGYSNKSNGIFSSAYIFQGDSVIDYATNKINNGGFNFGYNFVEASSKIKGTIGASFLSNIADALGMQNNGATTGFQGFAGSDVESLVHRVPAWDFNANVTFNRFNVRAEYVNPITDFSVSNLSYNGYGAHPYAASIEFAYSLPYQAHPSAVAVGYSGSRQALALQIPRDRYFLSYNYAIIRNTIIGVEYRHDVNYSAASSGTGGGIPAVVSNLGDYNNTLTAMIGIYF